MENSVVIYPWSPHMSLSVQGISEIVEYGRRNKMQVIVVLDSEANFALARQIVAKNKWPTEYLRQNRSVQLVRRGSRIHYPSYHFISKGKFARPPLPGYKLPAELDEFRKGVR